MEHLPDRVAEGLHAYLDRLDLISGSFDLAVDRAGDYWWLETETGLAMSSAFADLLAQGDRR